MGTTASAAIVPFAGAIESQSTGDALVPHGSLASVSSSRIRLIQPNPTASNAIGSGAPHAADIQYAGALSPSLLPPAKNALPSSLPSGAPTSATMTVAGSTAIGASNAIAMRVSSWFSTSMVFSPSSIRFPSASSPASACTRTVTGWLPAGASADSSPNVTPVSMTS